MLIRLFANREALLDPTNYINARWILSIPGKTIYANYVIISAPGITVFDPNLDGRPRMYLEFEGNLKKTKGNVWMIST